MKQSQMYPKSCRLCPRQCGADRTVARGRCGADNEIRIARCAPHHWEEPCISGTRGSGAVFFVGCPLGCVFCQNREISRGENRGVTVTPERLAELFLDLQKQGCHNINLVTATPYAVVCREVLAALQANGSLTVPVVWNTGGYETVQTVRSLRDNVSVFLPDMKFIDKDLSYGLTGARDYADVALSAIEEMLTITGKPQFNDEGILVRGTIIRHLVLPKHRDDSMAVLRTLKERFGTDSFLLSLMWQYTPNGTACADYPELNRRVTSFEYNTVADMAAQMGFDGFLQEKESAKSSYTPSFHGEGV